MLRARVCMCVCVYVCVMCLCMCVSGGTRAQAIVSDATQVRTVASVSNRLCLTALNRTCDAEKAVIPSVSRT